MLGEEVPNKKTLAFIIVLVRVNSSDASEPKKLFFFVFLGDLLLQFVAILGRLLRMQLTQKLVCDQKRLKISHIHAE